MKNSQNGQQDETPPVQESSPKRSPLGWGNNRCATQMDVRELDGILIIETTLVGLDPTSLIVTLQGTYFIVEGLLLHNGGRGRYARYVPELVRVHDDFVDVTYGAAGQLVLRVVLKNASDDQINPR